MNIYQEMDLLAAELDPEPQVLFGEDILQRQISDSGHVPKAAW